VVWYLLYNTHSMLFENAVKTIFQKKKPPHPERWNG